MEPNCIQLALSRGTSLADRLVRSAVIWIWAVTALRLANFLIVLPIALRTLPSELLGLWYLMLNLVGMVVLVEVGLSAAISRQATFFHAGASRSNTEDQALAQPNWAAMHGLVLLGIKIYSWLGWLVAVCCLGGGVWLALTHPREMLRPAPLVAFTLLTLSGTLRMRGLFWNPLLFGLQRVRESQRIQFTGILLSYGVSLAGLLAGGGILALAAGQAMLLLYPLYRSEWIVRSRMKVIFDEPPVELSWRPIWSSTWQAGGILLGSWLGTQGLIFACGQTLGLSVSASFSLSSIVAFTIHYAAQSWLLARYPTISAWWAVGNRAAIGALALRRIALAMASFVAGAVLAWVTLRWLLDWLGSRTPALTGSELAALFLIAGVDLFVALHSSVLASCNLFPHLRAILGAGILTLLTAFVLGAHFGIWGILAAPLVCQGLTTLWIVPFQCWRALRAPAPKVSTA
jgi:hypothetical protein